MTVPEVAARLALSVSTVRQWLAQRRIGYIKLGRSVRVPFEEAERLVERGTVPSNDVLDRPDASTGTRR
jgi:excisionase family DNA binding protein